MNRTFKVIQRHPVHKTQMVKRIYTSLENYEKYAHETFERYCEYCIAEAWELIDGTWKLLKTSEPQKPLPNWYRFH